MTNSSWQMKVYHLYRTVDFNSETNVWPFAILVFLAVASVTAGSVLGAVRDRQKDFKQLRILETSPQQDAAILLMYLLLLASLLLSLYFFYYIMVWPCFVLVLLAMMLALSDMSSTVIILMCNIRESKFEMPVELCGVKFILKFKWIFLLPSFVVVLMFFLHRHTDFSFIFIDILGFAVCANMIRSVRLPNLRILTVVLVCVFAYDIFMVFITPMFMKPLPTLTQEASNGEASLQRSRRRHRAGGGSDGGLYDPFEPLSPNSRAVMSVMESVALGGVEQLPLLFKVPHFLSSFWWNEENILCFSRASQYEMLGFGDVILPGLAFRFFLSFDLQSQFAAPVYFLCCMLGYLIGFLFTGLALMLMNQGQPALLYLVPGMLLPTFTLAAIRQEFSLLWKGPFPTENMENEEMELITEPLIENEDTPSP